MAEKVVKEKGAWAAEEEEMYWFDKMVEVMSNESRTLLSAK